MDAFDNKTPVQPAVVDAEQQKIALEVYKKLTAPFPDEALSVDSSRGFDLTSIKAQYVVERLNEVLGVDGWRFTGKYEKTENGVIFDGTLIARIGRLQVIREASGFSADKKNDGDSRKGARTDALSKASSLLGVGNDVFKGKVPPPNKTKSFSNKGTFKSSLNKKEEPFG